MTENTVRTLLEEYRNNKTSRESVISALAEYLYTRLGRFRLEYLDEDMRGDFIVSIYPRLGKIIEQFDPNRASFSTYLRSVIRLSYRTFTRDRYGSEARQKVFNREEGTRLLSLEAERSHGGKDAACAREDEPAYLIRHAFGKTGGLSAKQQEVRARRIFLLACKAGSILDDRMIRRIARNTGFSEQFLCEKLEEIRASCCNKKDKLQACIEKRNGYYIRTQRCLYEMKYLEKESSRYAALEKEYRYCLKRWTDMRRETGRKISSPSNRFLALALGISRGTIDATLASGK